MAAKAGAEAVVAVAVAVEVPHPARAAVPGAVLERIRRSERRIHRPDRIALPTPTQIREGLKIDLQALPPPCVIDGIVWHTE